MSVKQTHPEYDKYAPKWKRCRDVALGQDAVHEAGVLYLPKLRDQTDDEYKAMVKRATFYNASWRTIAGLTGMLFRKPPKQDTPAGIKDELEDVTMKGTPLNTFVAEVTEESIEIGRIGVLVDFPPMVNTGAVVTLAKAKDGGLRPMMQMYKAENIINWKMRRIANKTVLGMVVLTESVAIPKDEFKEDFETRYRVLDLEPFTATYRIRVFRIDERGNDQLLETIIPLMNGQLMNSIPFFFINTETTEPPCQEPPLIDLVDLNLAHYRVTADYEHGCHFAGMPTPVISGYQIAVPEQGKPAETFYIGSAKAWVFPNPDAKAEYLEFTGQGLQALEKNLDRKESQMAILGARMIAQEKKVAETATTTAIHRTGENSILASVALTVSLSIVRALEIFAEWAGIENPKCEYEINRDFLPASIDAQMLASLLKAYQSSAMSFETLFDLLQRGDMVAPELTPEQEQERIKAIPPPLPPAPLPNQPGAPPTT